MIDVWPEHQAYLTRNFNVRSPEQMTATELASSSIVKLTRGDEERFARHYRWTCDRLNEEELFFHRNGRYRLSTFAEALAEVYGLALGKWRALLKERGAFHGQAAATVREGI